MFFGWHCVRWTCFELHAQDQLQLIILSYPGPTQFRRRRRFYRLLLLRDLIRTGPLPHRLLKEHLKSTIHSLTTTQSARRAPARRATACAACSSSGSSRATAAPGLRTRSDPRQRLRRDSPRGPPRAENESPVRVREANAQTHAQWSPGHFCEVVPCHCRRSFSSAGKEMPSLYEGLLLACPARRGRLQKKKLC